MAVAVADALLADLFEDLLVIFQSLFLEAAVTVDFVHLADPLPYVKVPVTFTYHIVSPSAFLKYVVFDLVAVLVFAAIEVPLAADGSSVIIVS